VGEGWGEGKIEEMNSYITGIAKTLRKNNTDVERLLWEHLKARQLEGVKFRRQQPIGRYIVDFVSFEKNIVIEIDGGQHSVGKDRDEERDNWLGVQGFKVLRFWNNEIIQNIEGVLEVIRDHCLFHPPLNPLPSREGKIQWRFSFNKKQMKVDNIKEIFHTNHESRP
jgi:very-short-patch-repair endonuclease